MNPWARNISIYSSKHMTACRTWCGTSRHWHGGVTPRRRRGETVPRQTVPRARPLLVAHQTAPQWLQGRLRGHTAYRHDTSHARADSPNRRYSDASAAAPGRRSVGAGHLAYTHSSHALITVHDSSCPQHVLRRWAGSGEPQAQLPRRMQPDAHAPVSGRIAEGGKRAIDGRRPDGVDLITVHRVDRHCVL